MTSTSDKLRAYHGLSQEFWDGLGKQGQQLYALVRPTPGRFYQVDVGIKSLASWAERNGRDLTEAGPGGGLEMNPDFQRGHVWTEDQRTGFCEAFIRGQATSLTLFNCPSYSSTSEPEAGDLPPYLMQCMDGLQRFTALSDYAADKVTVFGGLRSSDMDNTPFDSRRFRSQVRIYGLLNRAEMLSFYLDLNTGGTIHTADELARVRALRDAAPAVIGASKPRPRAPGR